MVPLDSEGWTGTYRLESVSRLDVREAVGSFEIWRDGEHGLLLAMTPAFDCSASARIRVDDPAAVIDVLRLLHRSY